MPPPFSVRRKCPDRCRYASRALALLAAATALSVGAASTAGATWRAGAASTGTGTAVAGTATAAGIAKVDSPALSSAAPSDASCVANAWQPGIKACLDVKQIRAAYGLKPLLANDVRGKGETLVIFDSFGSPTLRRDLSAFDTGYGIDPPPSLRIIAPLGTARVNTANSKQMAWSVETTLDVEWAHAMAPQASIVVLTDPVGQTQGTRGLGNFYKLESYALDHRLGGIWVQSWGATEPTLQTSEGKALVASFEQLFQRADREGITVLASSGDDGATDPASANGGLYHGRAVLFPASSPLVTAVGGTRLIASASGQVISETAWNDGIGEGATGGGVSTMFSEPSWQENLPAAVQATLGGHRGMPDVSWNAARSSSVMIYDSFDALGWQTVSGTSESAPGWAGLVADVDQARSQASKHALGFLNPTLYGLPGSDFHRITAGNNSYAGVVGWSASSGWDAVTGLGTPAGGSLVQALIRT